MSKSKDIKKLEEVITNQLVSVKDMKMFQVGDKIWVGTFSSGNGYTITRIHKQSKKRMELDLKLHDEPYYMLITKTTIGHVYTLQGGEEDKEDMWAGGVPAILAPRNPIKRRRRRAYTP